MENEINAKVHNTAIWISLFTYVCEYNFKIVWGKYLSLLLTLLELIAYLSSQVSTEENKRTTQSVTYNTQKKPWSKKGTEIELQLLKWFELYRALLRHRDVYQVLILK